MMDGIRQYLLSVTAAAIVCGIITGLLGKKGTQAAIVKMLAGLFLALTVIQPFAKLRITALTDYAHDISVDASSAVDMGTTAAQAALAAGIKAQSEAYILDKADAWDASLSVEVSLSDSIPPTPQKIYLTGQVSPYTKAQLSKIIEDDLGISKENQIWTG